MEEMNLTAKISASIVSNKNNMSNKQEVAEIYVNKIRKNKIIEKYDTLKQKKDLRLVNSLLSSNSNLTNRHLGIINKNTTISKRFINTINNKVNLETIEKSLFNERNLLDLKISIDMENDNQNDNKIKNSNFENKHLTSNENIKSDENMKDKKDIIDLNSSEVNDNKKEKSDLIGNIFEKNKSNDIEMENVNFKNVKSLVIEEKNLQNLQNNSKNNNKINTSKIKIKTDIKIKESKKGDKNEINIIENSNARIVQNNICENDKSEDLERVVDIKGIQDFVNDEKEIKLKHENKLDIKLDKTFMINKSSSTTFDTSNDAFLNKDIISNNIKNTTYNKNSFNSKSNMNITMKSENYNNNKSHLKSKTDNFFYNSVGDKQIMDIDDSSRITERTTFYKLLKTNKMEDNVQRNTHNKINNSNKNHGFLQNVHISNTFYKKSINNEKHLIDKEVEILKKSINHADFSKLILNKTFNLTSKYKKDDQFDEEYENKKDINNQKLVKIAKSQIEEFKHNRHKLRGISIEERKHIEEMKLLSVRERAMNIILNKPKFYQDNYVKFNVNKIRKTALNLEEILKRTNPHLVKLKMVHLMDSIDFLKKKNRESSISGNFRNLKNNHFEKRYPDFSDCMIINSSQKKFDELFNKEIDFNGTKYQYEYDNSNINTKVNSNPIKIEYCWEETIKEE